MQKPVLPTSSKAPFELPLTPEQFRRAISIGHGRAWLHISRHGADGLHDILLHALLHSLSYDAQCEGDRGFWVMGMVDQTGSGAALYPEFIEHVHDAPLDDYDYWHIIQRATILGGLVEKGMAGARAALNRLFLDNRIRHPNRLLGAIDIIKVDGEKGLLQVCSVLGNEAREKGANSVDDYFLDEFDEDREEGAGIQVLESQRERDSGIDWFLKIRDAEQARRQAEKDAKEQQPLFTSPPPTIKSYRRVPQEYHRLPVEEIIGWIRNAPQNIGHHPGIVDGWFWLRSWGRKATDADLEHIMHALEETNSELEQRRYLNIFVRRSMPRVSDKIVGLAESKDDRVRSLAYEALGNVSDPRIRSVALRSLTPDLMKIRSMQLFQSSYEPGDHLAIERSLFVPDDVDELHSLIFDIADICFHIKRAECLAIMLFVYEYSPCGNCRGEVVETMVELGIAPEWLAQECRFDAMEDIREKFGGPMWHSAK